MGPTGRMRALHPSWTTGASGIVGLPQAAQEWKSAQYPGGHDLKSPQKFARAFGAWSVSGQMVWESAGIGSGKGQSPCSQLQDDGVGLSPTEGLTESPDSSGKSSTGNCVAESTGGRDRHTALPPNSTRCSEGRAGQHPSGVLPEAVSVGYSCAPLCSTGDSLTEGSGVMLVLAGDLADLGGVETSVPVSKGSGQAWPVGSDSDSSSLRSKSDS